MTNRKRWFGQSHNPFVEMAGAWATHVDAWNQIVRPFSTDYYCDIDRYRHPDLTGQVFNHQYNSVDLHCNRMAISSASLTTTISAPEPTLAYSGPATYSFGGCAAAHWDQHHKTAFRVRVAD